MNILFVHPSCPGQFVHLVKSIAQDSSHRIVFICRDVFNKLPQNVKIFRYQVSEEVSIFEACRREAAAVYKTIKNLGKEENFFPDLIVGHCGWGSLLYAKVACPSARVVGYFEWYFCMKPEFEGIWFAGRTQDEIRALLVQRNAVMLSQLENCDARFTPTLWQRNGFPILYRDRIRVIHEGVDTGFFSKNDSGKSYLARIIPNLESVAEIVTFASRGLEPTRCFPQFMEAVRILLKRRPKCHVLIAGNEKSFYGSNPSDSESWKQRETDKGGFDPERVHFTGWISNEDLRDLFCASDVHVYLTLPFVLSWSMLQAMSVGCCLVASAVPPVEEVIEDGINGLLTDISADMIADRIEEALSDKLLRERLGRAARETVLGRFSVKNCIKQQSELLFEGM